MKHQIVHTLWKYLLALSIYSLGCTVMLPAQPNSERTYFHVIDSAYNHGDLDTARSITAQAMHWARIQKQDAALSKFLIKYMSILIEQDYTQPVDVYYDSALNILDKMHNPVELANLWNIKARHLMYNQKYEEARKTYKQIKSVYKNFPNDPLLGYYYNDVGYLENMAANYQAATSNYMQALAIFESSKDSLGWANTMGNIAQTYYHLGQYDKAKSYAITSKQIRESHHEIEGLTWILGLLTEIALAEGDNKDALSYRQQYIHYAAQSQKQHTLIHTYANLAQWYSSAKNYQDALTYIQLAIAKASAMQYAALPKYYIDGAKIASELNNGALEDTYLDQAATLLTDIPNNSYWMQYHQAMMEKYRKNNALDKALDHLLLHNKYKDALINEQTQKQIAQLEIAYETQKKQTLLESAIAETSKQQLKYNAVIAILIIIFLSAVLFFSRYKLKRKIEAQRALISERNRISAELHDEVGSAISAINLIAYKGAKSTTGKDQTTHIFQNIHQHAQQLIESINDIVWSLHPNNEKLDRILDKMKGFAVEILESVDTAIEFNITGDTESVTLNPEKRKDIYLVFKEIINNIAKYASASIVTVMITIDKQYLHIHVEDDGIGFNIDSVKRGNGLHNMEQRMHKHQGGIYINSNVNKGTSIHLSLPYAS